MTINELRMELKKRGLRASGKKQDLVARLLKDDQEKRAPDKALDEEVGLDSEAEQVNKLSRKKIEQMAEGMMQMALDNLERDGYVEFAAILVSQQIISPVLFDAEQKARLGGFLRAQASTGKYDAIVIVSEAWTLEPSKEESLPLRVSEHPNRMEGVFVQMSSRHGDLMLTTHFKRDKAEKPIRPRHVSSAWQPGSPCSNFGGLFASAR